MASLTAAEVVLLITVGFIALDLGHIGMIIGLLFSGDPRHCSQAFLPFLIPPFAFDFLGLHPVPLQLLRYKHTSISTFSFAYLWGITSFRREVLKVRWTLPFSAFCRDCGSHCRQNANFGERLRLRLAPYGGYLYARTPTLLPLLHPLSRSPILSPKANPHSELYPPHRMSVQNLNSYGSSHTLPLWPSALIVHVFHQQTRSRMKATPSETRTTSALSRITFISVFSREMVEKR
jgi:hypothetical protein